VTGWTRPPRFEDYWPVDIDLLRPDDAYGKMVAIRNERMRTYVGPDGAVRSELVEAVPCPLCGGGDHEEQFRKEGFTFVRCKACGLIHVNPCLKEEAVKAVYRHQSYSDIMRGLMEPSAVYRRERFGAERVAILDRFLGGRPGGPRRLLDVGCATGFFLEAARAGEWDVCGVESNPYQAEFARDRGLNVRNETIEETTFDPQSFDAVTMFEIIEHVRRPVAVLEKVHALLRPGGMVFVYTPNFDCAERLILGSEAHFIWGSNHLTYFTVETLARALERAGFEVVHAETQGLDIEDVLWHVERHGKYDGAFLRAFRHELQFLCNAGGWGKNLRMYGRKPGGREASGRRAVGSV
jgi:2-polyprenyl-3-methyl-5-hydroxy-6-metoxy-1,4-benzoquinol methylase